MSLFNDWVARGGAVLGADEAMWAKVWDVGGDFAVNLTVASLILIGAVIASKWAAAAVRSALGRFRATRADRTLVDFFAQIARWVVMIIGVIAVLQRLGVQTASIIAVLGAASLAIGLALRGTLSDLAAGVMLLVLRPYRVGDQLEIDDVVGRVKRLDLFNTELTTPDNRKVVVPNATALDDMLINRNAYPHRRVDVNVDIHYDSDLEHAFTVMKRVAREEPLVLPEPDLWTGLLELKDSGMQIQLQAWVKPNDHFEARCRLLRAVKEAFDAEGIVFPYPHQVSIGDDSPLTTRAGPQRARPKARARAAPARTRKPAGDGTRARH